MSVTQDHIDSFHRFASERVNQGSAQASIDDLYDQWRLENPTVREQEADTLAVKAALTDMDRGDIGIAFDDHIQQMRKKYNIPSGE